MAPTNRHSGEVARRSAIQALGVLRQAQDERIGVCLYHCWTASSVTGKGLWPGLNEDASAVHDFDVQVVAFQHRHAYKRGAARSVSLDSSRLTVP